MWYVLNGRGGVIASDPSKKIAEMYADIEREKSGTARVISREEKLKLGGSNPAKRPT